MDFLKIFSFGDTEKNTTRYGSLFNALEEILHDLSESEIQYLVGVAGLMGKVAFSDLEFDENEEQHAAKVLTEHLKRPEADCKLISSILRRCTNDLSGIEDYRYTRMINSSVKDKTDKFNVVRVLFDIAISDGVIDSEEEYAIGMIAEELLIERGEYIDIRSEFKQYLSFLQN